MYGAVLSRNLLAAQIAETLSTSSDLSNQIPSARTYFESFVELMQIWGDAMSDDVGIGATGLLALLTAPLAWGLFLYHVYLVWAGMTTNETAKWAALRDEMYDGYVWKGKKKLVIDHSPDLEQEQGSNSVSEAGDWMAARTASESSNMRDWPVEADQVVLRTSDGKPPYFPRQAKFNVTRSEFQGAWERCYHLGQVDNMYDLGFLDNLGDAFFPNWRYL